MKRDVKHHCIIQKMTRNTKQALFQRTNQDWLYHIWANVSNSEKTVRFCDSVFILIFSSYVIGHALNPRSEHSKSTFSSVLAGHLFNNRTSLICLEHTKLFISRIFATGP